MFEITAAGAVMGLVGILYMVLIGRHLLPDRETLASLLPQASDRHFLAEVLVPLDSPLIGKSLRDAGLTNARGFHVLEVIRGETALRQQLGRLPLAAGDRLVLRSRVGDMLALREAGDLAFRGRAAHAIEPIQSQETVIMEGIVGPHSRLVGRRAGSLGLRRLYGAYLLAIHRQGESIADNFDEVRLQVGDTVLLEGPPKSMRQLFDYQELVNLLQPSERPLRRNKAPIAIGAVLLVMALSAFEVLPIAGLALTAATVVVLFRCLESDEAYGAIRWNILMLIYAMLALGLAMEKTGAGALIVHHFAALVGGLGPVAVLSAVYLVTMLMTEFMSNNATAVLLTPIAIGLAQQLGVDPRPFVIAVMFAASASFSTPIGYQTNTFVYSAGGYRFLDFVKVGVPLNLLFWATASFVIPWFWPLG
jgi:di/tricarboxylate transporter